MLKRIKKINKFGIFDQFTASQHLTDFSKFNLVYGWNGSGKTTLSKLLFCLSSKVVDPLFDECDFEIELADGSLLKSSAMSAFPTRVMVFNQQFIEDNIDWKKQGAKSLLVIAEDKIEERKRFFEIKDKLIPGKETLGNAALKKFKASEKERDDFLTQQAKAVKHALQLIDTSDTRYLNYDRTKIRNFIQENTEALSRQTGKLDDATLANLRKQAQPIKKDFIVLTFPANPAETFANAEKGMLELLAATVVSEAIDRLKQHEDINVWVGQGLLLHEHHHSQLCEFCGQLLPTQRLSQLNKHFNTAYVNLLEKLKAAGIWLDQQSFSLLLPEAGNFYDEFVTAYRALAQQHDQIQTSLTSLLASWMRVIATKSSNVFEASVEKPESFSALLGELEGVRTSITQLIIQHNKKTHDFEEQLQQVKRKLETHYVAEAIADKDYFKLLTRIAAEEQQAKQFAAALETLIKEKESLEASLANAAKGADEFNDRLAMFLGRKEIALRYDAKEKAYRMVRISCGKPAAHLSEAEKTAIGFVYFSIKLTENGHRVEDSIVVVDDPISSFDANHLFHSFAFLKKHCGLALQLFMLTHNFQYFKLLREWITKKNDRNNKKANVYSIEIIHEPYRRANLVDAHASLMNYGSEYHFLFKHLYLFKDIAVLDTEKAYQVANYSRKLLEAFFHFKFPKARNDFNRLMTDACSTAGVASEITEKVYRFINTYSHHTVIEFDGSAIDNQLAESENITKEVLDILEKSDANHYKELVEVCGN